MTLILNRIRTPDGTILTSYDRHDYVTHTDKNGEHYMTDGGSLYFRRSVNEAPANDMSVYTTDPFEVVRVSAHWGTRGKTGMDPLEYRPISTLSDSHIQNILKDKIAGEKYRPILEKELEYRKEKKISIIELD